MENKELIMFRTEDGKLSIDVNLNEETVWLNQKQMGDLFDRDYKTISKHINNIFKEEELNKNSTVAKFETVQIEGEREVKRDVEYYNLDVIISVGYRVKSKRGTEFRIWANSILKDYLMKGYALDERRFEKEKLLELVKFIGIAENALNNQAKDLDEARGIFKVLSDYSYALTILDEYDHQNIEIKNITKREAYLLTYEEAMSVIDKMKDEFSTSLFGNEKDDSFKGSLGAIYQTAFGEEVYPSIEEKASNLLYFIVKNHSFSDGNKRIAAAIFLHFMDRNNLLYKIDGTKKIADNTLVAITLMIAESRPQEKDIIVKVLVNLINGDN